MRHFERATALAFILATLGQSPALATDQTLPGSRLLVRNAPSGGRLITRLVFLTKASGITVPRGPDDPTSVGGSFEIYNPTSGESATFDMPASDWRAIAGGSSFRFLSRTVPSEVRVAELKSGRLKVSAFSTGIALEEPSQGSLGVVLTIGQQRYCTLFGGTVTIDQPGAFEASSAPAPASCPPVPPTTSTTTSTAPAPAALSMTPTSSDFGSVPILATSAQQTFSVTNTGGHQTGPLGAATLTGANAAEFTVVKNLCTTNIVVGGGMCQVTLEFIPNMTGVATAQLQFSATPGGTVTASLSGTGTPSTAALSIAPTSYDFGSVLVGTTRSSSSFIVTNTGGSPTGPLSAATVSGANAAEFRAFDDLCNGRTLGAGQTCSVAVDFTPSAPGVAMAQLQFTASPGGTVSVALSGTGRVPTTTTTTSTTTSTTSSTTSSTTTTSTTTTTAAPTTSTTSSSTTTTTLATCNPTGAACVLNTDCCSGVCLATNVCQ